MYTSLRDELWNGTMKLALLDGVGLDPSKFLQICEKAAFLTLTSLSLCCFDVKMCFSILTRLTDFIHSTNHTFLSMSVASQTSQKIKSWPRSVLADFKLNILFFLHCLNTIPITIVSISRLKCKLFVMISNHKLQIWVRAQLAISHFCHAGQFTFNLYVICSQVRKSIIS